MLAYLARTMEHFTGFSSFRFLGNTAWKLLNMAIMLYHLKANALET